MLLERGAIASGGTGKSCAIIRTHYSISSNTELALRSLAIFRDLASALGDPTAESGFTNTGYLILAGEAPTASHLLANLAVQRGLEYMRSTLVATLSRGDWFFYGNFYAAWAAWQYDGDQPGGSYWDRWRRTVYPAILEKQRRSDGAWVDNDDRFQFGNILPTAFAVLTLSIPDEQLPIFQR